MWVKICLGEYDFKAFLTHARGGKSFGEVWNNNGFDSMINYMGTSTAFEALLGERGRSSIKDFSEEDFETFLKAIKNYRKHGYMYWYEWSIKNWGTKWNAYGQNDSRNTPDTIYFQTANGKPIPVILALSAHFPVVSMTLTYADEDSGSNTGRIVFKNGNVIEEYKPESQSKEGYDIYFELHPDSRSEYKLVGDKYEYIESED
jgi:hypothetical protein